jgi:hypothetical protein
MLSGEQFMTVYQIRACYETGDSFSRYDTETVLEMTWTDLNKAKAALQRIKEHYEWCSNKDSFDVRFGRKLAPPEPEWHKGMEYDFSVKVELDNGNEVMFHAPWVGYFETLYSARVIVQKPEDDDLEIRFD